MKLGGSFIEGRADPLDGAEWWMRGSPDLHHFYGDQIEREVVSRREAQQILAPICPVAPSERWNMDRGTRLFPLIVDGQETTVRCVWEMAIGGKSDVRVEAERLGSFLVHGNVLKGGVGVDPVLGKILAAVRDLEVEDSDFNPFDVGDGEVVLENGDWEEIYDALPYKKGAQNDLVVMRRAAMIYEVAARFTDGLDFLINNVLRESGRHPKALRDKVVHGFSIPVMVNGARRDVEGSVEAKYLNLEARVEMSGRLGIRGGDQVQFRDFRGATEANFVDDEVFFPYQGVENVIRQIEVIRDERAIGGVNNYGATRLYGRQKNDDKRGMLQHFLNEGGNMVETMNSLGRMVAILEGLKDSLVGEAGRVRKETRRELAAKF